MTMDLQSIPEQLYLVPKHVKDVHCYHHRDHHLSRYLSK